MRIERQRVFDGDVNARAGKQFGYAVVDEGVQMVRPAHEDDNRYALRNGFFQGCFSPFFDPGSEDLLGFSGLFHCGGADGATHAELSHKKDVELFPQKNRVLKADGGGIEGIE